jgi:hypothetical protein
MEDIVAKLERLADMAEKSDSWTDEERLMPAAGVADLLYEAAEIITNLRCGWDCADKFVAAKGSDQ